jgi:hypothetical protein
MNTAKAKINLNEGVIELEGTEEFVRAYLDEFKELFKKPSAPMDGSQRLEYEATPTTPKKANSKKSGGSKKSAPKVTAERFDIHGNENIPSLQTFFDEKKPGKANGDIIAVIGCYITEKLGNETFTEGQVEYAYKMLNISRPNHLRQIMVNTKNSKDYFEQNEEGGGWKLTRTGEIFVSEQLPGKTE